MKREQQIRAAVRLLGGRASEEEVVRAIEKIEYSNRRHEAFKKTKQYKPALELLRRTLHRACAASISYRTDVRYFMFSERRRLKKGSQALSSRELRNYSQSGRRTCRYQKVAKQLLADELTKKPKRHGFKQRLAVRRAYHLLSRHGYKRATTRESRWYKLAAIDG